MSKMSKKLENFGIKLEFIEMESKGCFISSLNTMFVNVKLSEEETKRVIYHEMKHAIDHADYILLYKKPIPLIKMESEANNHMIKQIIEENGGIYNYTQLVEEFKISMGNDIKYGNL